MNKEDVDKLEEYYTRIVKWSLASGAITWFTQPGVVYPAAQNHWPNRKPWPLTEEESKHWRELNIRLKESAEKLDDTPQHLVFLAPPVQGQGIKFVK